MMARRANVRRRLWARMAAIVLAAIAHGPAGAEADDLRITALATIDPAQTEAFETAWRRVRDAAQASGYPFYTVYSESGAQRMIMSVISDYGDLAEVIGAVDRLRTSEEESLRDAVRRISAATLTFETYVSQHDVSRSYAPPGSYAGQRHHRLITLAFPPANREAVAALLAERRTALALAGVPTAAHAVWRRLGRDVNSVTLLSSAYAQDEHARIDAEIDAALGAAAADIDARLAELTSARTVRHWLARPELRLQPVAEGGDP